MKFWTIQPWNVAEIVMREGRYQPDFTVSVQRAYLRRFIDNGLTQMVDLYTLVLNSFNIHNHTNLPGVVFSFCAADDSKIFDIPSKQAFDSYMGSHYNVVESLMKTLRKEPDLVLLELDYPDDAFNPIYIDLNDFQAAMPPAIPFPPYTPKELHAIIQRIQAGMVALSVFPSGIMQAHTPYIDRENLVGIYPFMNDAALVNEVADDGQNR